MTPPKRHTDRRTMFSAKDLGHLLSDTVAVGNSGKDVTDTFKPLKPLVDPSKKVKVYRRGQKPVWAKSDDSAPPQATGSSGATSGSNTERSRRGIGRGTAGRSAGSSSSDSDSDSDSGATGRPRRRVVAAIVADSDSSDEEGQGQVGSRMKRPRARIEARVEEAGASDSDSDSDSSDDSHVVGETSDEEDDDAVADRRARLRRLAAQQGKRDEEEVVGGAGVARNASGGAEPRARVGKTSAVTRGVAPAAASSSDSSGSDSDSDSDSSDSSDSSSDEDDLVLMKPVFRRKADRVTVKEREAKEKEEAAKEQARLEELERRKLATTDLVASEIKREEDALLAAEEAEDQAKPDDTDDPAAQEEEYEKWALRELRRIKRDREEREVKIREQMETERRRKLTPAERAAEDKELEKQGLKVFKKDKRKLKFMQKYYHKGAFFMDEDTLKDSKDVRRKHYDGATGEDNFDKSAMPEVMQVRKFGLMGRTKWTHLSKEDTTSFDSPWAAKDNIRRGMMKRQAGMHGDLDNALRKRKRSRLN